jgi:hypothetical protein
MKIKMMFIVVSALIILYSNKSCAQENKWVAPKYSNDLINPFKGKESATAEGKKNLQSNVCFVSRNLWKRQW